MIGTEGNVLATERFKGDDTQYYLYNEDIQGSTTSLVKEDGSADATYQYTDFGETIIHGDDQAKNEVCYTGGKTDKGNTKEVWIYDLRNDMPSFGKTNPLKPEHFDDFIACYADGDLGKRKETYSEENPNGRWRKFSIQDILTRDKTSLDITWMKTESDTDNYTLAELLDQIKEKSENIAKAVSELEQLIGEVEE